ncbi:hypothetical protein [Sporolactobacillus laevolacticus]|uniref:Uncharacterized protein n=1 Tax=Sporolactobacillus laevolacticus DSM 442 TaxID=1395513 RepID=V6IXZ0_9BACL|nr:hypothetical protein [Sporolactobacillus laevolacticus]EST12242.1 hypothetical protein P343_08220 [Sporolactobacillus laevolacticus DSM 442]
MHKYFDLFFFYCERWAINIIIAPFFIFCIYNHICSVLKLKIPYSLQLDNWISNSASSTVMNLQGTLLTIASILIGIYFSMFTFLITINKESILVKISQKNFNKLLKFITFAFAGSFIYIFASLVTAFVYSPKEAPNYYFTLFTIIIIAYMILSSLRIGFVLFVSFIVDLKQITLHVEDEKSVERRNNEIMERLDTYLQYTESERGRAAASRINQLNEERHSSNNGNN